MSRPEKSFKKPLEKAAKNHDSPGARERSCLPDRPLGARPFFFLIPQAGPRGPGEFLPPAAAASPTRTRDPSHRHEATQLATADMTRRSRTSSFRRGPSGRVACSPGPRGRPGLPSRRAPRCSAVADGSSPGRSSFRSSQRRPVFFQAHAADPADGPPSPHGRLAPRPPWSPESHCARPGGVFFSRHVTNQFYRLYFRRASFWAFFRRAAEDNRAFSGFVFRDRRPVFDFPRSGDAKRSAARRRMIP